MRIRLFVLLCVACCTAAQVQAQQTAINNAAARVARAVDSNSLRAHLEFLADDVLEGRRPGTRGGELAARYIAAEFQRMGLEPAGDSGTYYHRVPIITLTPHPAVKVLASIPVPLTYRDDYVLWSMRNDTTVNANGDLVFVGYGIVAPENNWNDYEGTDVKNKIVVALVNDPGLRDSTIFRGPILTYYGRWTYKIEEARRQGAAGILLVHTTESATYPWTTVQSSWTGPQVRIEQPPSSLLVAGWLTESAATRLFKGSQAFVAKPTIPLSQIAAILNLDVMNLYGRTRDVSALGLDQSSLGAVFQKAAAAEGLTVSVNHDALLKGSYFRSDHFPFARAGVPGTSIENGESYIGQPADYGEKKKNEYVAKRYHQPSDEVLPSFSYDGALQQLRVIVRTAVAVANAPRQPTWNKSSEFREAGEARQMGR